MLPARSFDCLSPVSIMSEVESRLRVHEDVAEVMETEGGVTRPVQTEVSSLRKPSKEDILRAAMKPGAFDAMTDEQKEDLMRMKPHQLQFKKALDGIPKLSPNKLI
ncbi:hypothetical protein KIPB_009496, partial [Kipferlia bialata]|eukprot:g9496.t1